MFTVHLHDIVALHNRPILVHDIPLFHETIHLHIQNLQSTITTLRCIDVVDIDAYPRVSRPPIYADAPFNTWSQKRRPLLLKRT